MTREYVNKICFQFYMVEESAKWLEKKINAVEAELDLVVSNDPIDYERKDKLDRELSFLFRRNEMETRIHTQLLEKYGNAIASGSHKVIA